MGHFEIGPLEALGILFICGYFGGQLANWLRFPRVTGYIVAGILLSPSVFGIIPVELVKEKFLIINDIALAVIAYSVGGSLKFSKLKLLGKNIFIINLCEALGAFFLTFLLIAILSPYIVKLDKPLGSFVDVYLPMALIIAAVSAATAPAAILAIVHEYKAKGPLTTTLLAVVALDDGVAIILYAFSSTLVRALTEAGGLSLYRVAAEPTITIIGSILIGTIIGFLLIVLALWVKKKEALLVVILGVTFLCSGIAGHLKLSPLLANMMVGFLIVNKAGHSDRLFQTLENIEEPIFALFFTLAGAHFDLMVFKLVGLMALLIFVCRFSGKFIGTKLGAELSHAPAVIKKYLGYGLLPTAGVTVGLIFMAQPLMRPELFEIMVNAVLGSVIISEIVAPPLVKFALKGAGEAIKE
jgi:Kef-type K+ transport system membrane component KefB